MFSVSSLFASLSSFFSYGKKRSTGVVNRERNMEENKIQRHAHTDYRLIFDPASRGWMLSYGAIIELRPGDVDFGFFSEDGRTGLTTVVIHGNGSIRFDEEDMQLNHGDRIFGALQPVIQYPFPVSRSITYAPPSNVVVEMV
jgi:hypothetical protein